MVCREPLQTQWWCPVFSGCRESQSLPVDHKPSTPLLMEGGTVLRGVNVCLGVSRSVTDLDIPVALSSVALTSASPPAVQTASDPRCNYCCDDALTPGSAVLTFTPQFTSATGGRRTSRPYHWGREGTGDVVRTERQVRVKTGVTLATLLISTCASHTTH